MPIISKESFDKLTQEEKDKLRELYSNSVKVDFGVMRKIFGEEALQTQPLTYEDVARELFEDKTTFYLNDIGGIQQIPCGRMYDRYNAPVNCTSRRQAEKLLAINKLLNVAKFLNKDWKPDWSDDREKKFFPSLINNEIRIGYVMRDNSSPVYFRTEDLVKQAVVILGEDTVRLALENY